MEHKVTVIDPQDLIPQLLELLDETDTVPLLMSGNSMSPFLIHGRDTVYLSKITEPPQRGDMILYRRDNGKFVLHRVYEAGKTFTMVGDAQPLLEKGIRPEQMLAKVTAVTRKGKLLKKGSFWWDFFETTWLRFLPMRRPIHKLYTIMKPQKQYP